MGFEIVVTPAGSLRLTGDFGFEAGQEKERAGKSSGWEKKVADGFSVAPGAGLFVLGANKSEVPAVGAVFFWCEFAARYLTVLCRTPGVPGNDLPVIEPPALAELEMMAFGAPPMMGGEYLNGEVLQRLWFEIDEWVRADVRTAGTGLDEWLRTEAPLWHQVGTVCLHLAEQKNEPDYPFAFMATYATGLSAGGSLQYQPLGRALKEYAGERNRQDLIKMLKPLDRASAESGLISGLVESGDIYYPLAWTPAEAYGFLQEIPLYEECGLLVKVPNWWQKRPGPRVAVTIDKNKNARLDAKSMLMFDWQMVLGNETLSEAEYRALMDSQERLVFMKGQWVVVDRERLSEALSHWEKISEAAKNGEISFLEGMRLLAGASLDLGADGGSDAAVQSWSFVKAGDELAAVLGRLRNPDGLVLSTEVKGLRGELRPYQKTGLGWMWFLAGLGLGACLADDMGLGKTIQVISLILALKEEDSKAVNGRPPSLLVLPASLLANWKAELERFAPDIRACFLHASELGKNEMEAVALNPGPVLEGCDLVVTTYGMVLRQEWLREYDWRLLVLDEAQAIKNAGTKQTKAVKKLRSEARIALTGTPVENNLGDLWSLFDFLCPGLLSSSQRFKSFVKDLEERRTKQRYAPLRELVRPYILRRLKTDKSIISDLPDKTEVKAFCPLSKKQITVYSQLVEKLEWALENVEDGIERKGLVLGYIMKFKQLCNHPSQLQGDSLYEAGASGKFLRLEEICGEIAERQEKTLIFTQFREITEPLADYLAGVFGRPGLILHGGTPVKKRMGLVDAFQQDDGPPFFVLSLKAGGTGLNLTAASHIVHFDRWWNPAVENQATDRAFRIGQRKNVLVHKFVCRGTIEEKIDAMIEDKKQLAGDILDAGAEKILTELGDEELLNLVALDIERAGDF